eukprot:PLAT7558.1.p1 GENE.PLAT7558.1~~PLAT7558.1.p1  ORF type:complete len:973 (-),score=502.57 PLAT7558.1:103-3021(-)
MWRPTLNLPRTAFPLRASAAKREPERVAALTGDLYRWQQRERGSAPLHVLHDGPPYANGDLHMGHMLNKVLKDFVNRVALLAGKRVHYVPGWDCHGLPIELKALEGVRRSELTPLQLRERAGDCARSVIALQADAFRRWGVLADWSAAPGSRYETLQPAYEAAQLRVFRDMLQEGLIYRSLKPVAWSPSSQTALAEAELEYSDEHVSSAVHVAFPILSAESDELAALLAAQPSGVAAVAWTTTPWTLKSNQALCVAADEDYSLLSDGVDGNPALLVASALVDELAAALGRPLEELARVRGAALSGATAERPFADIGDSRTSPILLGSHVTMDSGTGIVHTAPAHGVDDFDAFLAAGFKAGDALQLVDDLGRFTSAAGEDVAGLSVLSDGNEAVMDALSASGRLLAREAYQHRYPYDWRTKKPTIVRATRQWFADLSTLNGRAVDALQDVRFVPPVARTRLTSMLGGRAGWCISRQRTWGVPIPAFYHRDSGEALLTADSVEHVARLVEEQGSDVWWTASTEQLLPPQLAGEADAWQRGTDTMDVWFDSGSSWAAVLAGDASAKLPADVYLEGSDQHRGWFQSSLLTSVACRDAAPYKAVITHGFVLDERGHKMSKSQGNVTLPGSIIDGGKNKAREPAYGADVARLWAATTDYSKDVQIGSTVMKKVSDNMRKLRNCARFMLGNLSDFNADEHSLPYDQLRSVDRFLLHQLLQFDGNVSAAYADYNFHRAFAHITNFSVNTLSSFYFDITKDRLYVEAPDSIARRSCQTALHAALQRLTVSIAPVLCFTADEIYQHAKLLGGPQGDTVFHADWQPPPAEWRDDALQRAWDSLLLLRGDANRLLEEARKEKHIGSSLEARLQLQLKEGSPLAAAAASLSPEELVELFITSDVELLSEGDALAADESLPFAYTHNSELAGIAVLPAEGCKCPRCWKFSRELTETDGDLICPACVAAVDGRDFGEEVAAVLSKQE